MSDDTENTENTETGAEGDKPKAPALRRPLSDTRDSDVAQRPGFRNPANARSKAQKKSRKNKR